MKSFFVTIRSILLLFIFLLAIFFCITMPFEIRKAILSQSWEPRDLQILSSKIVTTRYPDGGYRHSIEIMAIDLSNNKKIRISDIKYGDMPHTFSAFGKILSSDLEKYVQKYPAGAKVVGYKDTNSEKCVLEKGDIKTPVILLSFSVLWILGNVFIMIRYPKSRREQNKVSDILTNTQ